MPAAPDGDANVAAAERLVVEPLAAISAPAPMEEAARLVVAGVVAHRGGCAVLASRRGVGGWIALPARSVSWPAERADGTLARIESR